jgi:hypothetical protein
MPGFEKYNHCYLEGHVVGGNGKTIVVDLNNPVSGTFRVKVDEDRVFTYRSAEPKRSWVVGDKVQVYEINEGVGGWWDATIIDNKGKQPLVKWRGSYEGFPDQCRVSRNNIRGK